MHFLYILLGMPFNQNLMMYLKASKELSASIEKVVYDGKKTWTSLLLIVFVDRYTEM